VTAKAAFSRQDRHDNRGRGEPRRRIIDQANVACRGTSLVAVAVPAEPAGRADRRVAARPPRVITITGVKASGADWSSLIKRPCTKTSHESRPPSGLLRNN